MLRHVHAPNVLLALALPLAVASSATALDARSGTVAAETPTRRVVASYDLATGSIGSTFVETKPADETLWLPATDDSGETLAETIAHEASREIIPVFAALTVFDCNLNGIPDASEISAGAQDFDADGVLDSCEYAIGDLNLNGLIDQQDVSILLGWWGIANPAFGDLDADGAVTAADLGILLSRFGVVTY